MEITIKLDDFDTRNFKHCEKSMYEDGYTDVTQTEVHRAMQIGLELWFMSNQHRHKPSVDGVAFKKKRHCHCGAPSCDVCHG